VPAPTLGVPSTDPAVDRPAIIARERRWATPAAIAAVAPFVLYVASVLVEQSANLETGGATVEELRSLQGESGTLLAAAALRAVGFLGMSIAMLYLFRAAQARNPRVPSAMLGFVFIGPVLLAAQGIVAWSAQDRLASQFASRPHEPSRSYREFRHQLERDPSSIAKVTIYPGPQALDIERADGTFYAVKSLPAAKVEDRLPAQLDRAKPPVDHEIDSDGKPGEAFATKLVDDSSERQVASGLLFPAVLGMVVMMIYVPLQALRVGLLSRFVGSLGVALGASMILILPVALLATLLWLGYVGLLYVGRVPGGRPPAWTSGEAMPWPKPGEERPAPRRAGGTIEGEATEVEAGEEAASSQGPRSSSAKRKRKRRR
jgi:uncharacterized membrane protein YedE/YeeE